MKLSGNKLWNRVFILCMIVSLLSCFANNMLASALPIFTESLGYGTDIAGTMIAIATFFSMFGRGLSGGFSGRMSRKWILVTALISGSAAFLILGFSRSLPLIFLARILQGIGAGIIITILCTVAFDTLNPAILGSGIGLFGMPAALSQCIAPSIGTFLADRQLFTLLFISSAVLYSAALLVMLVIPVSLTPQAQKLADDRAAGKSVPFRFRIEDYICREALPAAFLLLMAGLIHAAFMNYVSICGLSRGIAAASVFFTILALILIFYQPLCGKLADRLPTALLLIPGFLLMGCSCIILAFAKSLFLFCLAAVFYALGYGPTQAAGQYTAIRSVEGGRSGVANSTYYVGGDIGLAAGAWICGMLAAKISYTAMYLVTGGICALTALIWLFFSVLKRRGK